MANKTQTTFDTVTESLAKEIEGISNAIGKLRSSRLNEKTIVLLIHDALPSGYGGKVCNKGAVREVLYAAANLKEFYLKKEKELQNGPSSTSVK